LFEDVPPAFSKQRRHMLNDQNGGRGSVPAIGTRLPLKHSAHPWKFRSPNINPSLRKGRSNSSQGMFSADLVRAKRLDFRDQLAPQVLFRIREYYIRWLYDVIARPQGQSINRCGRALGIVQLTMITGSPGCVRRISFKAPMPSISGISMSSVTTSGSRSEILASANCPFDAMPTTSISESEVRFLAKSRRITAESSTMRTRIFRITRGSFIR